MLLTKKQLIDFNLMGNSKINIDYDSFEVITNQYAKDKNSIYLIDIVTPDYYKLSKLNLDIESFDIISNECIKITDWPGHAYTKDKNWIYYLWVKIEWVDIESFGWLKNKFRIRKLYIDKNHVICDWQTIKWININEFKIVSESYAIDDKFVYYIPTMTTIKWSDPKTFKVINVYSWEDKDNIYEKDKSIKSKKESLFNRIRKKYNRLFV